MSYEFGYIQNLYYY